MRGLLLGRRNPYFLRMCCLVRTDTIAILGKADHADLMRRGRSTAEGCWLQSDPALAYVALSVCQVSPVPRH